MNEYILDFRFLTEIKNNFANGEGGIFFISGLYMSGKTYLSNRNITDYIQTFMLDTTLIPIEGFEDVDNLDKNSIYYMDEFEIIYRSTDDNKIQEFFRRIIDKGIVLILSSSKDIPATLIDYIHYKIKIMIHI